MGVAPATRCSGRGTTWRCHLGGCSTATRAVGGSATILGGNRTALGRQLITQADMFMWRRLLPVFRGEDDRDTRSCQLCFLPKELLFSVS